MLQSLLQRAREARAAELGDGEGLEEGFTLIELMVVLLIIAILLAIAIPTFLGVTNSASDRAAQSNLTTALTEAKAIYQNSSNYLDTNGNPIVAGTFTAQAAEFSWNTAGCGATSGSNCMSFQIIDVGAANDGQGLVLATFSTKDSTCWYALDLEAAPQALTGATADGNYPNATAGVPLKTTAAGVWPTAPASGAVPMANAGVYYAKKTSGANATTCNANWAATRTGSFNWGSSYASPGSAF